MSAAFLSSSQLEWLPLRTAVLFWVSTHALPTALASALMWRRIHAAGPLVLTFTLMPLLASRAMRNDGC